MVTLTSIISAISKLIFKKAKNKVGPIIWDTLYYTDLITILLLHGENVEQLQGVLAQATPVLHDVVLVLLLVLLDLLVGLQDVDVVGQVEDNVLHHLQVIIVLSQTVEIFLEFVKIFQNPPSYVHFFVHVGILKQLQSEVCSS